MSRGVPIRRSLLRGSALVVVLLGVAVFAATFLPARSLVRSVVAALVERTVQQTETELLRFVEPAERLLLSAQSWGREGLFDPDQEGSVVRLLLPVVDRPYVTAVLVVDETGRGQRFSLQRGATTADAAGPPLRSPTEVRAAGVDEERSAEWLRGAVARLDEPGAGALYFTEPGMLTDGEELGLTGAVAFREPDGGTRVFAIEFLLGAFQDFVAELELTEHSVVVITDERNRLLAISDESPLWRSGDDDWRLRLPTELDSTLVDDALRAVETAGPSGVFDPIRFRHAGEDWWGQGREVALGGGPGLGIAVLVPARDLLADRNLIRSWVLGLTLAALVGALWFAARLGGRVSEPIEVLVENSERMSIGDLEPGEPVESRIREVRQLAEAHDHMRAGLRSLMKLERDLQIARQIQQSTLPQLLPTMAGWQLAGWSEPADETGGDVYDLVPVAGATPGLLLFLADATGHGIGPALSASRIGAMVRMGVRGGMDLPALAAALNQQLHEELPGNRFVTAWMGLLHEGDGRLTGFSAGQGPLLRYDAGRRQVESLPADAPPFGMLPVLPVHLKPAIEMAPGDVFAVLSDGFFEANDERGEELGGEVLERALAESATGSAEEILAALRREVERFVGEAPPNDDRTALIIKRI